MKRYVPPRAVGPTFLPASTDAPPPPPPPQPATSTATKAASPDQLDADLVDPSAVLLHTVVLRRFQTSETWGFKLRKNIFPLVVGQAEARQKLVIHDVIISINGRRPQSYDEAIEMIQQAGKELQLLVSSSSGTAPVQPAPVPQPTSGASSSTVVAKPIAATTTVEPRYSIDGILKHIPRVTPSVIYDGSNCPFSPEEGFTESFHNKMQDFITMRSLGAYGAVDRIVQLQGRGQVRSSEELVKYIGSKGAELVKRQPGNQAEQQRAARQQNTLCALLGDLKRAREDRWKDDVEQVAQRRSQAMENLRVVQKLAEEGPAVATSSLNPIVVPMGPPPPLHFSLQQAANAMIHSYLGSQQLATGKNNSGGSKSSNNFPRSSEGKNRGKKR